MIYRYDEPTIFPVRDLYDSGMMLSYLSAVQRQYELNREDQKEFLKNFGDYTSPWNIANLTWYDETMGRVNEVMNAAAAQGIDLTRSQEGRALLGNLMRNVNYSKLAGLKEAAKAGEMYQKAKQQAIANGTWNEDREKWALKRAGLPSFEEYDPNVHGIWNRTAPAKFTTLFDATNPWFEGMKDGELTKEQVEALGYVYDPMYDWTGISKDRMADIIATNTPGWMTSEDALYYYDVAKRELLALGNTNPTPQLIQAQLNENIFRANHRVPHASKKANEFAKKKYDYLLDVALEGVKQRNRIALERYKNENSGGGSGSGSGSRGSSKGVDSMHISTWLDGIRNLTSARHPEVVTKNSDPMEFAWDLYASQKQLIANEKTKQGVIDKLSFTTPELNFKARFTGRRLNADGGVQYKKGDKKRMLTNDQLFDRIQQTPTAVNGDVNWLKRTSLRLSSSPLDLVLENDIVETVLDNSENNTVMFVDKDNKLVQYQKVRLKLKYVDEVNEKTGKKTYKTKLSDNTFWIKTDAESMPGSYAINNKNMHTLQTQDANFVKNAGGKWEGYGSGLDLTDITSYGPTNGLMIESEDPENKIQGFDDQADTLAFVQRFMRENDIDNIGEIPKKQLSEAEKRQIEQDVYLNTPVPGFGTRRVKIDKKTGKTIK